jgi:hypothetical protein
MKVGAVDVVEDDALATKYGVDSFPAIVFIAGDKHKVYDGKFASKPVGAFLVE